MSHCSAKYVPKDETTFPNIIPTKGTRLELLARMRCNKAKKINVPKIAKIKEKNARLKIEAFGKNNKERIRPSRALCMVPTVEGEVNLFCVICCINNPESDKVAPAMTMLIVLGNRVVIRTFHSIESV